MSDADLDATVAHCVRAELPALYVLLDADDRVVETNRHTQELFASRITGTRFADLLASFDRDAPGGLARASDTPRFINIITFTGLPQSFFCWFSRVGDRVAVIGGVDPKSQEDMRRDLMLAHQKLAARTRELARANIELTRLSAMRDTFFGMAAHDLRSPLTAILWLGELLSDDLGASLADDHRECLSGIRTSAEMMQGVVDGFLRMAMISAGQLRILRATASLSEACARALAIVRPAADRKPIALRVEEAHEIPPFSFDRPKLEQVLVNLVKNAVEHSPPRAEVEISLDCDGVEASVAVRDHGAGIAPAAAINLFKAYSGAGNKTAGERSTGLGLAISKMIVEAHGGQVTVETEAGRGTTFTVRLPLSEPPP